MGRAATRRRAVSRYWIVAAVALACSRGWETDPTAPPHGQQDRTAELELLADWALTTVDTFGSRITHLADLPCSLALHGIGLDTLPGMSFRLDTTRNVRARQANEAGYLREVALHPLAAPETLRCHQGLGSESLAVEALEAKLWLEALTGLPCETFAYPNHEHARPGMEYLVEVGYLAARDGAPGPYPWAASLLGHHHDPVWHRTWEGASLYELPLLVYCADIQALALEDVASWAGEPERLPHWKEAASWVQLYTHTDEGELTGTPILDAAHLAAFVDALLADGDVLIGGIAEISAWLRTTHAPDPAEPLVWRPLAAKARSEGGPWQGKACAFSFSTDDGWKANLHEYAPVFVARGLTYTAYLNPHKIIAADGGGALRYMDSQEVLAFAQTGMEIGNHGYFHRRLLPPEVGLLGVAAEAPRWFEIVVAGEARRLRVYGPAAPDNDGGKIDDDPRPALPDWE